MALFGKRAKSPDFDKLFEARAYGRLIRHLAHEDMEITEKSKETLNHLAADDEASRARERSWRAHVYDSVLEQLEAKKLSGKKDGLEEFIRTMSEERDVKLSREDALGALFKENGLSAPTGTLLDELFKILEPDE